MNVRTTAVGFAFGVGRSGAVVAPMIGAILLQMNVPYVCKFRGFLGSGIDWYGSSYSYQTNSTSIEVCITHFLGGRSQWVIRIHVFQAFG